MEKLAQKHHHLKFTNSWQSLPSFFFETVTATPLQNPQLVAVSLQCAKSLELNDLPNEELRAWLNGEKRLPGDQQISTRYAGHQFGHWAGQLGDGRAISLGEFVNSTGERWEIQTKGSGLTPFSRMGDGKAVIRSSLREFLASEHLHALGIPSTRALALITGTDSVEREQIERSAIVARAFPSNLRFGHFEAAAHLGTPRDLEALLEYTLTNFFPQCHSAADFLLLVTESTAELMAHWMTQGFCHGVMNTDNMSILGLTIDYGPFAFQEKFNLSHISNHSDHQGRYSFDAQPDIGLWNIERLLICFQKILNEEQLQEIHSQYFPTFTSKWAGLLARKLGMDPSQLEPTQLPWLSELFRSMHFSQVDFSHFFRSLSYLWQSSSLDEWRQQHFSPHYQDEQFSHLQKWLTTYHELKLGKQTTATMLGRNPKYVLRNYIAQEIIEDLEKDNTQSLHQWLEILTTPFAEHGDFHKYSLPHNNQELIISCSS